MFIGDVLFPAFVFLLIFLFLISIAFFIMRLLKNHDRKMEQLRRIEEKLDKILAIQEK